MLTGLRRKIWYTRGRLRIRSRIAAAPKVNLILGGSYTLPEPEGWINTDLPHFNILKEDDWSYLLGSKKADSLLCEHVLEHLTEEENLHFFGLVKKHLKQDGNLRIAVPDALHPDEAYINYIRPGGNGPGCEDHKMMWTYRILQQYAEKCGFRISLLQYYTEEGKFTDIYTDDHFGLIHRDVKKLIGIFGIPEKYSSLIADIKPC